jgi:YjbE family integral membrane protein
MGFDGDFYFLGTSFKVFFIDLLLSGDNAVVIALACRSLPAPQMRKAIFIGTAAAILLRVYLTLVVSYLLEIPGLKLVGAVALLIIAIKLIVEEDKEGKTADSSDPDGRQNLDLWSAVFVVVVADLIMSLDNVVALAAVAKGSIFFLALGLLLSIPLLMFGSLFVAALLKRYPLLITAGGALLGWIAGDIGITDPLIADWVSVQAPALIPAMPLLGAIFVLLEGRIIEGERARSRSPKGLRQDITEHSER